VQIKTIKKMRRGNKKERGWRRRRQGRDGKTEENKNVVERKKTRK
jgi:hypothetical protein